MSFLLRRRALGDGSFDGEDAVCDDLLSFSQPGSTCTSPDAEGPSVTGCTSEVFICLPHEHHVPIGDACHRSQRNNQSASLLSPIAKVRRAFAKQPDFEQIVFVRNGQLRVTTVRALASSCLPTVSTVPTKTASG